MPLKSIITRFKPYLRWVILALTMGFLLHSLRENWQQVLTLQFKPYAIACLIIAMGVTLLAHIWSGWVWFWVMRLFSAPVDGTWSVIVYLKTNLAKYLPGNVWHFVGRVQFLRAVGTPTGAAVTGVVLEPLLMSAAALAIVVVSLPSTLLQGGILLIVLLGVHPRILNPILARLTTAKLKQSDLTATQPTELLHLRKYPLKPLIGEVIFVLMRGLGFLLAFYSLESVNVQDWWLVMGTFSFAWLLGLIVPGAPGGLGVFEATALALLTPKFSVAVVLGTVALYRLTSTLSEALGAGLATIDERWNLATAHVQAHTADLNTLRPLSASRSRQDVHHKG